MALGKIILEESRAGWNAEVEFSTGVGGRFSAPSFDDMLKLLGREYKRLLAHQSGDQSALIRRASIAPPREPPPATFAVIQEAQREAGLLDLELQRGRKSKRAPRAETHTANPPPAAAVPQATRNTRRSA